MSNFDTTLFRAVNDFAGRTQGLDMLGVFAAVILLPLMVALVVLASLTIKRLREEHFWELPLRALVAGGVALAVREVVGVLVGRARPFAALADVQPLIEMNSTHDSFPSGHAAAAFAIALVVWKHDRDWGAAFLILAALVALSRVFVGVHYPSDIVAGALLGWGAAAAVHWFEKRQWSKIERALRVR